MGKFKSRSMSQAFLSGFPLHNRNDSGISKIEQNIFITTLVYFAVIYSAIIVAYLSYNFELRHCEAIL